MLKALQIMTSAYGYGWSPKRVTLSTVGLRKGLQRYIEECDCHLAISLHSPFPAQRQELMPAEKAFSIVEIVDILRQYDFSKLVGVYLEPGVSYYFDNGSDVRTIYKDKPFNFNLNLGVRFTIR